MRRRSFRPDRTVSGSWTVGVLLIGLLCSACAPSDEPAQSGGAPVVRLLTHDAFALSEDLIAEFERDTGATLEIVTGGDAGSLVTTAILAAGDPGADVLYGVDSILAPRAVAAEVFAPYQPADAGALVPELRGAVPQDLLTPVDYGDVCINIDEEWFARAGITPPASLADLRDPAYRGLLVVQDPAVSSPGLAFLLATIATFGDGWQDYWRDLRANDVLVVGDWTTAYVGEFSASGEGDRPLVVSYATSPPAEIVYAAEDAPATPRTSAMVEGCYRQVEYAGVLRGSKQPQLAGALIDWLISAPVQADLPLSMFVLPARTGVAVPEVIVRHSPVITDPLTLPSEQVATELPEWLAAWDALMRR